MIAWGLGHALANLVHPSNDIEGLRKIRGTEPVFKLFLHLVKRPDHLHGLSLALRTER